MIYQIVSPFVSTIEGNSFKEAIKNFAKINYNYDINQLIIKDQMNHYDARIRYYKENNVDKVGITVYPYQYNQLVNSTGVPVSPVIGSAISPVISPVIGINSSPIITAPGRISASAKGAVLPMTPIGIRYNY